MFEKFATALAWIVGSGCAFCAGLAFLVALLVEETPHEHTRTIQTFWIFLLAGIAPWAWLIAKYWM